VGRFVQEVECFKLAYFKEIDNFHELVLAGDEVCHFIAFFEVKDIIFDLFADAVDFYLCLRVYFLHQRHYEIINILFI
jgi:hypothetical protein